MQNVLFLQDLAVVMIVAGMVTLLFLRLKQPVVLGYLLAGFIIGPYTPPFPLVQDMATIQTMSDLGVVFLMFALGLEFNLRKLRKVGSAALGVAIIEISAMIGVGYLLGLLFGWSPAERVLLGIMLALTSTTIVIKSLRDRHALKEPYAQLLSGVSIFDDVFVIFVMILLPSVALTGTLPAGELLWNLAGLTLFLVGIVVAGLLGIPKLLRMASKHRSDEILLILVLSFCFGIAILAAKLDFSPALGAFLAGAIVAESREAMKVMNLTAPIRDMFLAVFFVSIGMLIDPRHLADNLWHVAAVLTVYLPAKVCLCSLGAYLFGSTPKDAMRVGTTMAQIGEFTFILATIGMQLELVRAELYPIIVSVAALNALVWPYLVDSSERFEVAVSRFLPTDLKTVLKLNRKWIMRVRGEREPSAEARVVRGLVGQIVLNIALIASVFMAAAVSYARLPDTTAWLPAWPGGVRSLVWFGAAAVTLPIYIATVKKMQALNMMLSGILLGPMSDDRRRRLLTYLLSRTMLAVQFALLTVVTIIVSSTLLPPFHMLAVLLVLIGIAVGLFGRHMNRWYSRHKFALLETLSEVPPESDGSGPAPPHDLLQHGRLRTVRVANGALVANRLIRETELRSRHGVSVVAIRRKGDDLINPDPDEEFQPDDEVLLIGQGGQLDAAEAEFLPSELGPPGSG